MRKCTLTLLLAISVSAMIAQTEKGAKLVGVNIGSVTYSKYETETNYSVTPTPYNSEGHLFSISLTPNVAWFVRDKIAIGGNISFTFSKSKDESGIGEFESTMPSFYIGPMARYYFGGSNKGMPFAQLNFQAGFFSNESENLNPTSGSINRSKMKSKSAWIAGTSFGYEHFITANIGCYGSIGFSYTKTKTEYESQVTSGQPYDVSQKNSRFEGSAALGFQIHLPSKSKRK